LLGSYKGINYRFSSTENVELFKLIAQYTYEPAYGGWCAYAMGNSGEKVEVDPQALLKLIDGKLIFILQLLFQQYFEVVE
jgi:hypothetical protein